MFSSFLFVFPPPSSVFPSLSRIWKFTLAQKWYFYKISFLFLHKNSKQYTCFTFEAWQLNIFKSPKWNFIRCFSEFWAKKSLKDRPIPDYRICTNFQIKFLFPNNFLVRIKLFTFYFRSRNFFRFSFERVRQSIWILRKFFNDKHAPAHYSSRVTAQLIQTNPIHDTTCYEHRHLTNESTVCVVWSVSVNGLAFIGVMHCLRWVHRIRTIYLVDSTYIHTMCCVVRCLVLLEQ